MTDLLIAKALRLDADEIAQEWAGQCAEDPALSEHTGPAAGTDVIVALAGVLHEGTLSDGLGRRATDAVETFAKQTGSAHVAARQLQCLRKVLQARIAHLVDGEQPQTDGAVRLAVNLAIATAQRSLVDQPDQPAPAPPGEHQGGILLTTTPDAPSLVTAPAQQDRPAPPTAAATPSDLSEVYDVGIEPGANMRRRLLVLLDFVTVFVASFAAALACRRGVPVTGKKVASVLAYDITCMALIALQRLYMARVSAIRAVEIARLARVAALAGLGGLAIDRVLDPYTPALEVFVRAGAVFLGLAAVRGGFRAWLHRRRKHDPAFTRSVIIVGTNDEAMDIHRLVQMHPEFGYRVAGFVGPHNHVLDELGLPWLGDIDQVVAALKRTSAKGAIVASSGIPLARLNQVVRRLLKIKNMHVHLSSGLRGIHHRRVVSHPLAYEPLLYLEQVSFSRWQRGLKRALDLVIGTLALVVSLPVIALAALAIKVFDGGPVIFKQRRVGQDGETTFTMYKFRTMATDAEQRLAEIQAMNQRSGPLFKVKDDPRVTKVGQLLRDMDIDELPQLLNVLKGSMSLVGPRPALPHEVKAFENKELNAYRQQVRPGMTGMWQDRARDDPSFGAYERWDSFYVENWSVMLDLAVLFSTAHKVASRSLSALFRLVTRRGKKAVSPPGEEPR